MKNSLENLKQNLAAALALESAPSFDGDIDFQKPPVPITAQAAVLIIVNAGETPNIVLTKRTSHLRNHAGQVAFPGGKIDADDASSYAAALREAHEEISLPIGHELDPIGTLPEHHTITGFCVTPHLVVNQKPFSYIPEAGEVEAVFEYPLSALRPENFRIDGRDYQGKTRHFYVLAHEEYYIWGATARILHQLAARLADV